MKTQQKCKTGDWGCLYHACMSDDCQYEHVIEQSPDTDWHQNCKPEPNNLKAEIKKIEPFDRTATVNSVIKEIKIEESKHRPVVAEKYEDIYECYKKLQTVPKLRGKPLMYYCAIIAKQVDKTTGEQYKKNTIYKILKNRI